MLPGALILDGNCLWRLESPDVQRRFEASLRSVHLELWLTSWNVVEAAKTGNKDIRRRLLQTISALKGRTALLPDPISILNAVTQSALENGSGVSADSKGFEQLLLQPSSINNTTVAEAQRRMRESDQALVLAHTKGRPIIQEILERDGLQDRWSTAAAFLDDYWMKPERISDFVRSLRVRLKMPGDPPLSLLLSLDAWRLYLEGLGIIVYRSAIAPRQGKQVQVSDVSQLVYLAGGRRSVLVTADRPFLEAARDVVHGRYRDARILYWDEFIALWGL